MGLRVSLYSPPHQQHKSHWGTLYTGKLSHLLPSHLVDQALQVVVIWGYCCGTHYRAWECETRHKMPNSVCQASSILFDPTSTSHPLSLLVGSPKSRALFKTYFQKAFRDRSNGKTIYFSYVITGTWSIIYSYKKGLLCRGHWVFTERSLYPRKSDFGKVNTGNSGSKPSIYTFTALVQSELSLISAAQ